MYIGVYGLLRKGERNHNVLMDHGGNQFVTMMEVPGFMMYTNGAYPLVVPSDWGHNNVLVEVYQINADTNKKLEQYFSYPSLTNQYTCILKRKRDLDVIMYYFRDDEAIYSYPSIPSGNWIDGKWVLVNGKMCKI